MIYNPNIKYVVYGGAIVTLRTSIFVIPLLLLLSSPVLSDQKIVVKHYQIQARYEYGSNLLDLALSKLDIPYEISPPEAQNMNEARGELKVIEGQLDLEWLSTNEFRETKMIPVRIPIYQGVLGLRLLLVKKENYDALSRISSIDELRQYVGGHGLHWGDLPVYSANNLEVRTNTDYSSLFKMLALGRFDYLHRGLTEIWSEQSRHKERLVIAGNVMLFYPHPVYYFVSKHRPELAVKIKKGLNIAMADGSFKKLFLSYNGTFINNGKLDDRELIVLKNPVLPTDTPVLKTDWWLPKKFEPQLNVQ